MEPVLISCPQCGKELRLRDPKLIGRQGKCAKCGHQFLLELPAVESPITDSSSNDTASNETASNDTVDSPMIDLTIDDDDRTGLGRLRSSQKKRASQKKKRQKKHDGNENDDEQKDSLKEKSRRQPYSPLVIVSSLASLLTVTFVIWLVVQGMGRRQSAENRSTQNGSTQQSAAKKKGTDDLLATGYNDIRQWKPPQGKPVSLNFIPSGARMIFHIRPAEIWGNMAGHSEMVRQCLGPLGDWAESKIRELLLFPPSEIEEAVICLFFDDRNAPPEVACSVRLTVPKKRSLLIEKFAGRLTMVSGRKIYMRDDVVGENDRGEQVEKHPAMTYWVTDDAGQQFAVVPKRLAQEMIDAERNPGFPVARFESLLKQTDRQRHFTILFDPMELRNMQEQFFSSELLGLLEQFLIRFDETDVEAVAWSLHWGDEKYDQFYSEILLRSQTAIRGKVLRKKILRRLELLPEELLSLVKKMRPRMIGEKKLVGRLPVMSKAFRVETVSSVNGSDQEMVRLTTILPKIAGPNLAAACFLAWQLAAVTDFSKPPPKSSGTPNGSPSSSAKIVDRIQQPIDADFNRVPLQELFEFIAEETKVRMKIDGDALKDSGYTKNMPQTFKFGTVPATNVLREIQKNHGEIVFVVDEEKQVMTITTKKFAAEKQLTPLVFPVP